jgi:hypothetical protein
VVISVKEKKPHMAKNGVKEMTKGRKGGEESVRRGFEQERRRGLDISRSALQTKHKSRKRSNSKGVR